VQKEKNRELYGILKDHDLRVAQSTLSKEKEGIKYIWRAYGKPDDHTSAMLALVTEEDVQEFRVIG
jgi:predicted metal-dependent hydrolase